MYDIVIIGGGINGCGIARDASGRGLSVLLAEKDDLASGTSSWSTKLIHGGLRYLEHYEFRLVREALSEREVLWSIAPHIIHPARFVLPHHRGLRPAWLLRLGLFLYDHIGGRKRLPATRTLDLRTGAAGASLQEEYVTGFEFSDCCVDDARLVVLNAMDAAQHGADIRTRTSVISARRENGTWSIELLDHATGKKTSARAKTLVNASGPWIDGVLKDVLGQSDARNIRLVKGSHFVVPKLYDHDRCYIFQNSDGRVVFAIPYESDFTLVGTTDVDHDGKPQDAAISKDESQYLCDTLNGYFRKSVTPDQIVWSYSGVRPLYNDNASLAQEATRDYVIKTAGGDGTPLLINIFGGKLTTYRRLAEDVVELAQVEPNADGGRWTKTSALPGGNFACDMLDQQVSNLLAAYPWLEKEHARRLMRTYGTLAVKMLSDANSCDDLGVDFGSTLYAREVTYLMDNELAKTAEDILWRRTKLGLRLSQKQVSRLQKWVQPQTALAGK